MPVTLKTTPKATWIFWVLLLGFCVAKWTHLQYSFYWDESWSYAPGVRLMYDHGPSLMPNSIDTFYSRGHPLFFYAAAAAWMHLTGGYSHFNAHLYALLITLGLLIVVYRITLRWVGPLAALTTVLALMLHVGFFVQASAVVPEMMVALFSLLAIAAFAGKRFLLAGTALTLLLFTKESGIVAAFSLGTGVLLILLDRSETWKTKGSALLSVLIPGLLIGTFFLAQKHYLGWYLYPEHTGLIKLDWGSFYGKFQAALGYLLAIDGPRWLVKATLLASVAAAIRTRKFSVCVPAVGLTLGYLIAQNKLDFLPEKFQFALFALIALATIGYYLRRKSLPVNFRRYIALTGLFVFAYLCFCCINFFTTRYLLAILVPIMIGLVGVFVYALKQLHPRAVWVAPLAIVGVGFFMFRNDTGLGDVNLQSFNAMAVQDSSVRFLERHQYFDRKIGTAPFQEVEHLKKPYTGYLHTPNVFKDVKWDIDGQTELALFNNIEPDPRVDEIRKNPDFQLVYRVQKGAAWAEIYRRKSLK